MLDVAREATRRLDCALPQRVQSAARLAIDVTHCWEGVVMKRERRSKSSNKVHARWRGDQPTRVLHLIAAGAQKTTVRGFVAGVVPGESCALLSSSSRGDAAVAYDS